MYPHSPTPVDFILSRLNSVRHFKDIALNINLVYSTYALWAR